MVCYKEPSEKLAIETVWKRAGTCKKYLAGDWMNHLSISVLTCEVAVFVTLGPNHQWFRYKHIK